MNIGIIATVTGTGHAGYFNGNIFMNGGVNGTGNVQIASDSTLKTNIQPISNAISTLMQLQPKAFYYDTTNTHRLNFSSQKQYGFLAQNVKITLPELVTTTNNPIDTAHPGFTFSAINYNAFIGLLTAGMQEQQQSIDSLRSAVGSGGGGGVSACSGILPNHITKWSSAGSICNTQITDDGYNVGIGGPVGTVMFNVLNNDVSNFGRNRAVQFYSSLPGNSLNNFGSVILSEGSTSDNIGMQVEARNIGGYVAQNNWGIQSYASGASQRNFAGLFVADQPNVTLGSTSYGIYAQTTGFADINYGVYAKATQAATCWAGYFDGNVNVNGFYFQNGSSFTSDRNLKTNIDSITNATGIIRQLKPSSFYFDTTNTLGLSFSGKKQYGLIAQDVQTVLPELVSTFNKPADVDTGGNVLHAATSYKTLNYNAFIAILIKSNQEQQQAIDSLRKSNYRRDSLLNALASAIDNCCQHHNNGNGLGKNSSNNIDVQLNNADIIVLNQNTPNPFAEQTFITYNIPQNISVAQILFYDINGRNIKTVDITKKGPGQLNVYANDLTNGVYSYTLIADGKIIDTKKMVKQQ